GFSRRGRPAQFRGAGFLFPRRPLIGSRASSCWLALAVTLSKSTSKGEQRGDDLRGDGAAGVQQDVRTRGNSPRDKRLMEFINRGVGGGHARGRQRPNDPPVAAISTDRAQHEPTEDEIFNKVRRLADEIVQKREGGGRGSRQDPFEDRHNQSGSIVFGKPVGGKDPDNRSPEKYGPLPAKEPAHPSDAVPGAQFSFAN